MLDKVTGDLFTYDHSNKEWLTKGNSGLHHLVTSKRYLSKRLG